jgi:hypothetical protein
LKKRNTEQENKFYFINYFLFYLFVLILLLLFLGRLVNVKDVDEKEGILGFNSI